MDLSSLSTDTAREVVALLAAIAALPFIGYLAKRWWERPKLRVKIREHDLTPSGDGRLVFEVTNHGGRITSLKPAVRFRITKYRMNRSPVGAGLLERAVGKDQLWRWLDYLPQRRTEGRVAYFYDMEGEGEQLRLEPHGGSRRFAAELRSSTPVPQFILFPVLEFYQEGQRRPTRLRFIDPGLTSASAWRFWLWRVVFFLAGQLPRYHGRSITEFYAERQARD